VLKDLFSIIARRQKRYVGIIATDPRDQIFLASAVREICPGVQVFILDNDQMLTLQELGPYLKGTILGSTYPLLPENQFWTNRRRTEHLCFPSQAAQGYYNAILAQLDKEEDNKHSALQDMIEYRPPSFDTTDITPKPPVWITMIGQNGDPVPLQFFTHLDDDANCYVWPGAAPQTKVERSPMAFPPTTLPTLILLLALSGFVSRCAFWPWRSPLLFWKAINLNCGQFIEGFIYRLLCLASLIILLLPFVALHWLADLGITNTDNNLDKTQKILLGGAKWLLVFLAMAVFIPLLTSIPLTWEKKVSRWGFVEWGFCFLAILVESLLVIALADYFIESWHARQVSNHLTSWQAMFLERSLNLSTGVSPLLPLIFVCLTLFLWFVYQLRRLYLADQFSVANPFPSQSAGGYPFKRITDLDKDLQGESRSSWEFVKKNWGWVILVLVVVSVGAVRLYYLYLPSAEGMIWTRLFFLTFTFGFFLVAANLLRFLLLWWRLKKLLGQIAFLPMTRAFSELPLKVRTIFASTLPLGLAHSRPHRSAMRLSYHLAGLLREETKRLLEDFYFSWPGRHELVKKIHANLLELNAQQDFPPDDSASTAPDKLRDLTRKLLDILTSFWPEHSVKDAFGDGKSTQEEGAKTHDGDAEDLKAKPYRRWVELAEDVVAVQTVITSVSSSSSSAT